MRWILLSILILILAITWIFVYPVMLVGTSYSAKTMCSGIFVSKLSPSKIRREELVPVHPAFHWIGSKVDFANQKVKSNFLGIIQAVSYHHPDYGCRLHHKYESFEGESSDKNAAAADRSNLENSTRAFDLLPSYLSFDKDALNIDFDALENAIDEVFSHDKSGKPKNMRALVVVHKGRVIAERYGKGISAQTPLKGWSMAKSVTGLLAGQILVDKNIKLNERVGLPGWESRFSDKRKAKIFWSHLLRMTSGLSFEEHYDQANSDVMRMLFRAKSAGQYAAKKNVMSEPGVAWAYSSGTTNILAMALHDALGGEPFALNHYAQKNLFEPLGITTAALETDGTGVFIGSSFIRMSAHDWAKLGILIAQQGRWQDQQIISENWIDFMSIPVARSNSQFGAHIWLNKGPSETDYTIKNAPQTMVSFSGHDGQLVLILPDQELVIVRLAEDPGFNYKRDVGSLLDGILSAMNIAPSGG